MYLTGLDADASYQITGPGEVRFTTGGVSASTPWKGLPGVGYRAGAGGRLRPGAGGRRSDHPGYCGNLADLAEPFYMGGWENGRPALKAPGLSRCTTPASTPTACPSPSSPRGQP